jgi:hypothetical protein
MPPTAYGGPASFRVEWRQVAGAAIPHPPPSDENTCIGDSPAAFCFSSWLWS